MLDTIHGDGKGQASARFDLSEFDLLAKLKRWVAWKLFEGRKIPVDPRNLRNASTSNPATWGTRSQAFAAARRLDDQGLQGGVGIVLGDLDDGRTLFGVDLDSCRDPATEAIAPWAEEVIQLLATYTEISPSGTGLKIFGFIETLKVSALRTAFGTDGNGKECLGRSWKRGSSPHPPGVELYFGGRYFTVTGKWDLDRLVQNVDAEALSNLIRLQEILMTSAPTDGAATVSDDARQPKHRDTSRSGVAWAIAGQVLKQGGDKDDFRDALAREGLSDWAQDERQLDRAWDKQSVVYLAAEARLDAAADDFPCDDDEEDVQQTRDIKVARLKRTLPLVLFSEIEPALKANDFVEGLLTEGSAAVVFGDSNAGKTFWTTDLSLHVAAGRAWNDKRVKSGGVVYCVLEGGNGFRNRVAGWQNEFAADKHIPFAAIPSSLNLLNPKADTPRLIEAIRLAAERLGVPIKLVVIDTLSRAMSGGNENAPDDMGALVSNMDAIRAATGACVMFVHHTGKDAAKGMRGSSVLRAAIDTEIEVKANELSGQREARVGKQRDLPKGAVFGFRLQPVRLGQNEHGEDVTTCVVEITAGEQSSSDTRPLSGQAKIAYNRLLSISTSQPDGSKGVTLTDLREELIRRLLVKPGAKEDSARKAANRAIVTLCKRRLIEMRDDLVLLPRGETGDELEDGFECDDV